MHTVTLKLNQEENQVITVTTTEDGNKLVKFINKEYKISSDVPNSEVTFTKDQLQEFEEYVHSLRNQFIK
jgi:hypothetical protein